MEHLFDLERAVEAVENRVPLGKPGMRLLLSGALIYALFYVFRALTLDLFWPSAQFVVHLGLAFPAVPKVNLLRVAEGFVVGSLAGTATVLANKALSNMIARIRDLESAVDKYRSLFWQSLSVSERTLLVTRLTELGRHQVQVSANENPDCVELARELQACFKEANWEVLGRPLTGALGTMGATGITIYAKDQTLAASLLDILSMPHALTKSRQVEGPTNTFDVEVWVIVGPKRLGA